MADPEGEAAGRSMCLQTLILRKICREKDGCHSGLTGRPVHTENQHYRQRKNSTLTGKWVCNPFCQSQCPSKRSKVLPVSVTLWRSV